MTELHRYWITVLGELAAAMLVAIATVYVATFLRFIAWAVTQARWEREFPGWRILLRDRVDRRRVAPRRRDS